MTPEGLRELVDAGESLDVEFKRVTPPCPRDPLLADAFKRAGIVERTARGIDMGVGGG
jgi:ATP-dependent DNA helicase RecG